MTFQRNCFLFFLLLATRCLAQSDDVTNVAKLTLLNPGFGYEVRTAKYQTLHAQLFMNTALFGQADAANTPNFQLYFDPAATLQYRYYYNNRKRLQNEKRTDKNSMNYVALVGEVIFSRMPLLSDHDEEMRRRAVNRFGALWGLQRNFQKHFSLDLNVGLGYLVSTGTYGGLLFTPEKRTVSQLAVLGQLNVGFWFGGK